MIATSEIHQMCNVCGIPWDAGYFDETSIQPAPTIGEELVLAQYQLHRNYCGILTSFAQFTDKYASDNSKVLTTGYFWQIRCNGQPRDPYLTFDHIINPWGQSSNSVQFRLEEGCLVEIAIRNVGANGGDIVNIVGGRITGRYWYNTDYGGAPNRL
jgi:hypothetical protein